MGEKQQMRFSGLLIAFALMLVANTLVAQPAEYDQIFERIKLPDEVVSAEFNVAGSTHIFSVEINSEKKLQEIRNMFLDIGLKMVSAVHQPPKVWKVILTNASTGEIPVDKFEEALMIPWMNKPDAGFSLSITDKELVVTTYPADPDELSHNLELAAGYGMKFSGSEPSPDNSSAVFTLKFDSSDTVSIQRTPEVDSLADEFAKFATVLDNENSFDVRNYKLATSLDQVGRLLDLPARFNRTLKYVSVNCLDQKQAQVLLKVADRKSAVSKKLEVIKALLQDNPIQWAENGFKTAVPVMTGFETDFGDKISLTGISPKSSLIFSQFFSMISRCKQLKNPFFSRGTYQDTDTGRVMVFCVDCDW
jgi:hypothetical protein